MSLILQRDREVAIKALEKYASSPTYHSSFETNALLDWIKLEYFKYEN